MTLFVVQARGEDAAALSRATFVPDAFSWPAFAFGPFWLLYRRLWLVLLVWVALEAAFILLVLPHVATGVTLAVDALAHLLAGLEGNRWRQGKLARSTALTDLVEAHDADEAEVLFFHRRSPAETSV